MNVERAASSFGDHIDSFIDDCLERENKGEINFGKYRGRTIEDVYRCDPNYCAWLNSQPLRSSPVVKEFLRDKFENITKGDVFISFGKYKHKPLSDIARIDPGYIRWLKQNELVKEKCKKLHEAVMKL